MNNLPNIITLKNKKSSNRRTIHLLSNNKEIPFKSASAKCNAWVKKEGLPIILFVRYGNGKDITNEMVCETVDELRYGLQAFVKEYRE